MPAGFSLILYRGIKRIDIILPNRFNGPVSVAGGALSNTVKAMETDSLSRHLVLATRSHEIQTSLGNKEVPEFEALTELGMSVRLALHVRGLPIISYEVLKLVATHCLGIPSLAVRRIVELLAEVEFLRLQKEGTTIKGVLPTVPFYDELYSGLGEFSANERTFNESEQLALDLATRLSQSPHKLDALQVSLGADTRLFKRGVQIGTEGNYIVQRRCRGRDVVLTPTYFSENANIFADAVAAHGATTVQSLLNAIRQFQGWPLTLIERSAEIGEFPVLPNQIALLKRLAQDGAVKPPSIETAHSGLNYFLFTPTPSGAALSPTKREIYERAMAVVAAIRQGQLLPRKFAIRSPGAILYRLYANKRIGANTEAIQQYRNLVQLRVGSLVSTGNEFFEFQLIETPENLEAVKLAYDLVTGQSTQGIEVDDDARLALQQNQEYVESLIASGQLRQTEIVKLDDEQQNEIDLLLLGGAE